MSVIVIFLCLLTVCSTIGYIKTLAARTKRVPLYMDRGGYYHKNSKVTLNSSTYRQI